MNGKTDAGNACTFINDIHGEETLRNFLILFEEKVLTDVTIKVGGRSIECHKNVLAALSPYFRTMFTSALTAGRE